MKIENGILIFYTGRAILGDDLIFGYAKDIVFSGGHITPEEGMELANYMIGQWQNFHRAQMNRRHPKQ